MKRRRLDQSISLRQWIGTIERLAPEDWAFEWDCVGLQVGDPARSIHRVATALEATETTVQAAIQWKADLLFVHHPLIWEPLRSVTEESAAGRAIARCIENRLAVYVAHTNWDLGSHSMTKHMGQQLNLQQLRAVCPKPHLAGFKLAVFVPEPHLAGVRRAMSDAGAGVIGDYRECSFSIPGTGTFFGGQDASPALGRKGQLERVEEQRLEMHVPKGRIGSVIQAMVKAHPYEEAAYDLYPTEAFRDERHLLWTGRRARAVSAATLAKEVRRVLKCDQVRLIGDPRKKVRTLALCSGGGKSLLRAVASMPVDAFVTGDIDYHSAREAEGFGLTVIDAGHFDTEKSFPQLAAEAVRQVPSLRGLDLKALAVEETPLRGYS